MSAPKKPGKDLSALKARLAKKKGDDDVPAPGEAAPAASEVPAPGEPAPPAGIPAPGEVAPPVDIPAPGEVAPPAAEIPPPGEVAAPAAEIPPPGQVAAPAAAPVAAAPAPVQADLGGDPFDGGSHFDPNAGLIDDVGVEIKPKSNVGLIALVAVVGLGVGVGAGMVLKEATFKRSQVAAAKKKGEEMLTEVNRVAEARAKISLRMEDLKKDIIADPEKGQAAVQGLIDEVLGEPPKPDMLFSWQFASLPPEIIKATFDFYEEANGLDTDLRYLAGYLAKNGALLKDGLGGPSQFAVIVGEQGASLTELTDAFCGVEGEGDEAKPKKCGPEEIAEATHYGVRDTPGSEEGAMVEKGKALILAPVGDVFKLAFGAKPSANAISELDRIIGKISVRLENMNKVEKRIQDALGAYTGNPNVDGDAPSAE